MSIQNDNIIMDKEEAPYPLVAIGASAGGVHALQQFFGRLPSDTGACFVVIVHLNPYSESRLPEIIGACTSMSVVAVEETAVLSPNCVYVIPPNRRLQITNGEIWTHEFDEPRGRRAPIDLFFRSFADQHGDGFAIVLTGAGADGAVGVKAVKEAGGLILVQDPADAEYASMPYSAIATGVADIVLPINELADELTQLIRTKAYLHAQVQAMGDNQSLHRILHHLRARTGHDFTKYKRATVLSRVTRRMQLARTDRLEKYFKYLHETPEEVDRLFGDLLISVTTFFRDPGAFESLATHALPPLFKNSSAEHTIRVWVPGCASGEEAYSIAMLLLEEASRHDNRPEIQIFASDLDTVALMRAREGCYPISIEADVSEERLRRFFVREGQFYRIRGEVRDVMLFATHSLLKDPPFSRVDLISCRNLLIYLDRELQHQAVGTFNYALRPGGYLFLGSSENADHPPGLFRTVDCDYRIYQSIERAGQKAPSLPMTAFAPRIPDMPLARPAARILPNETTLHRQALEDLAPPSILVDEIYHIMNLSETAGRYLLHPPGPPTSDFIELARPELRMDLRSALQRAFEQHQATLSLPIPVRFNGKAQRVYVQVKPVITAGKPPAALVIFIEGGVVEELILEGHPAAEDRTSHETIQQLRDELQATRIRLKTSREEEEATNEELRAANEELQSINEEYRSTAEELETSKEELQSLNEELQTLNNELKLKLEVVSHAHNDLENLMAATDVGTLFLDNRLRIKRFTPRVEELFNIAGSDEGRSITDFTHQLDYDRFAVDAQEVLKNLVPIEREVKNSKHSWFLMRMRPYRTLDDKIEGVVVTFVDVTERRYEEDALRESETRLKLAREASDLGVQDYNPQTDECWWDERARALYGIEAGENVTMDLVWSRVNEEDLPAMRAAFVKALEPGGGGVYEAEFRVQSNADAERWIKANGKTFFVGEGSASRADRLVATVQDISDRKAWECRQRLLLNELSHRVKNTLAVVQSLARQSFRMSPNTEHALSSFEGRLGALSAAHDMLVKNEWRGAELGSLVRRQLGAQLFENSGRVEIEGPPVMLPAELATPFGLLIHELGTNAFKHGALSSENGTVRLTWKLSPRPAGQFLEVSWREQGGPQPDGEMRSGLGSILIEQGLPGAEVNREILKDGLAYKIALRLES